MSTTNPVITGCYYVPGLIDGTDVAITADGHNVYAASAGDSAVSVFARAWR